MHQQPHHNFVVIPRFAKVNYDLRSYRQGSLSQLPIKRIRGCFCAFYAKEAQTRAQAVLIGSGFTEQRSNGMLASRLSRHLDQRGSEARNIYANR